LTFLSPWIAKRDAADANRVPQDSRVYAIGDVAGGLHFTHVANYHAGIVIRKALFRIPVKVKEDIIPWVTFTDPELAHAGLTEDQAVANAARKALKRING